MRPVNLLPEQFRPRAPSGRRSGSAYVVLGALGVLLVMVGVYAFVSKQVADREAEAARLNAEATAVEAQAAALAPYGEFADLKATRLVTVASLAQGRVDWERLSRELSFVLPEKVWLSSVEASTLPEESTATTTATTTAPAGPSVTLLGCAPGHPSVATTLVRLRRLDRAVDVKLTESAKADDEAATGATDTAAAPTTAGGESDCGKGVSFTATVELSDPAAAAAEAVDGVEKVPASLGGGQ